MTGLLVINKEKDMTSRDVVNSVSRILKLKKIGHTGTLDPLAVGVLVLCLGRGTKLNNLIMSEKKEYIAEVRLGIKTDTLDITGNVISKDNKKVKKEEVLMILKDMTTTYKQEVPIYSAVKVNGKKLYEYARNNEEVILPKKEVTIYKLELLSDIIDNTFTIKCEVSKGCYIRALINDIAFKLGTIGIMENLTRTKQGKFNIENAYTLNDIKEGNYELLDIKEALGNIKEEIVDEKQEFQILNGVKFENTHNIDKILYSNAKGELLALYKRDELDSKTLKVEVMLKI